MSFKSFTLWLQDKQAATQTNTVNTDAEPPITPLFFGFPTGEELSPNPKMFFHL